MRDRIYIFVPRILGTPAGARLMPSGRMGAQCAHAAAKLAKKFKNVENMTTLVMEVPSFVNLQYVQEHLKRLRIGYIEQLDSFEPFFDWQALQAIITEPISKRKAQNLELYDLWK